jgi:hypothetical protein
MTKVIIHGLPTDHRQGHFNKRQGEIVHTCHNGQKMVRFPNGSQWAFDAQYVVLQSQRQVLANGVEIVYAQSGQCVDGTVMVQGEKVGTFAIDRQWNVTTGRRSLAAESVRSAVGYLLAQYRKGQVALDSARQAFGCV